MKNTMFKVIASLACAVVLAACGGGAKTDTTTPLPPQPTFTKSDVQAGTGDKTVAVGDLVAVHFTGYLYDETKADKKGAQFATTRITANTAPSIFTVGVGNLIAGLDQGIVGMKVGGVRNLLVPSSMAWGPYDHADVTGKVLVPANTAVVYDVEVFTITTLPLALFSKLDTTVGSGTEAAANNLVTVNYTGYIYDASKADKKGAQFDTGTSFTFLLGVNSRIGGWEQGIPGMKIGGKRTLYIPSGLAYAQWGRKDSAGNYVVPQNTAVVYDIELTAVNTTPPTSTVQPDFKKVDDQLGTGAAAVTGNTLLVQYTGYLYNDSVTDKKGLRFDTSRITGTPFSVKLGEGKVIKGWEDGLLGMQAGGRRTLYIPANLAYGSNAQTNIPANSALIFEVEVISITP
jgi:FKBP-type peptidyl-prolyl cis-trans isomerase